LHSADCLLRSVNFAAVEVLQRTGRWNEAGKLLTAEAQALAAGGTGHFHDVIYQKLCLGIMKEDLALAA
jgi:hypothetical protein